jgi:protein-S-isoprenylcysteine O-methyltransferase Ste14
MDVSVLTPTQRRLYDVAFSIGLVALPAVTWYVTIAIQHYGGALVIPDAAFLGRVAAPTATVLAFYLGWLAFQALLAVVLPGRVVRGVPLESGQTLPYKLNGLAATIVTLATAFGLVWLDVLPATFFYDQLGPLLTTANVVVFALCFVVYAIGRRQATPKEKLRSPIAAYFMGAALNPRTGSFDWKFFSESRPGMILWILINLSYAAAQYERIGTVSSAMLLVCAFQILYVIDYFVMEEAILTTWDIRHEPFGFMLGWGCLVWVPFTFSLQGLYLVEHGHELSSLAIVGLVVLNMTGYVIFRGSNLQKHRFRQSSSTLIWGKPAQYIQTARGTKLLVSGFWGIARHSNYLGDLMMGLAWCLTTGFSHVLPYFYFIYFVILLVHRERRDHDHCAQKYGKDWEQYTARVRWRMLPFVY